MCHQWRWKRERPSSSWGPNCKSHLWSLCLGTVWNECQDVSALQQARWPVCPDTAFTEALANRALRVKICCQCLIKKQRGGLWRDALCIWRALLAKLLLQQCSRSIQIRWWSHLPSAEEEGRGIVVLSTCMEEGKVLAQGLDREGHLLAWTLLWLMPGHKAYPKAEAQMPSRSGVCTWVTRGRVEGGTPHCYHGQPWPHEIKGTTAGFCPWLCSWKPLFSSHIKQLPCESLWVDTQAL